MKLAIISYGAGNVFSVKSAFERLGIEPILTADPALIESSDLVVFPGVGHAEARRRLGVGETHTDRLRHQVLRHCDTDPRQAVRAHGQGAGGADAHPTHPGGEGDEDAPGRGLALQRLRAEGACGGDRQRHHDEAQALDRQVVA